MKPGTKVRIKENPFDMWSGHEGVVACKVKETYMGGKKVKPRVEYIVQFPRMWSYFRKKDMQKI